MREPDVLPALLAACPSFRQRWQEYTSDEIYEPNQVYVEVFEFARHFLTLLQKGDVSEFPAVFAAVENILHVGNEEARQAVTTGLLEDLYFEAEETRISPSTWRRFFGPMAMNAWECYLVWAKKSD